jgi:AAHS family 4-hydroxybenzoate transporter-like MFS transporter
MHLSAPVMLGLHWSLHCAGETMSRTIDVAALIDGRRLNGYNYFIIVLSWLITAFDGVDAVMIGFTLPYIRDELHLTTTMLSYIASAGNAGMAIGALLAPLIADRLGRRPAVVVTAIGVGVLMAATAWANSFESLLVMRFVNGLAIGGLLPLAWALNIEFVPKRLRATVVTVIMVGYSVGSALAGPLTNAIGPTYGWQGVYFVGGIGALVCAAALWLWLPESIRFLVLKERQPAVVARTLRRLDPSSDATEHDRFVLSDELEALKVKASTSNIGRLFAGSLRTVTPLLWLSYFMSSMGVFFVASFGPTVLEDLDVARPTAALVKSAASILGAGAGLLLMRFTDRFGPISISSYAAVAVPVLLLVGFGSFAGDGFIAMVLIGTTLMFGAHFGMHSIAGIYYPSAVRATGAGAASAVAKCGAIMGPLVGGAVLTSNLPLVRTYALLAVCPVFVLVCVLAIAAAVRVPAPARDALTLDTGGGTASR